MSVSSGTVSLFSAVAFFIAAAGGIAYGFKHKDDVLRVVAEITGKPVTAFTSNENGTGDEASGSQEAAAVESYGDVTLRATDNGHFETTAEVNGRDVEVMVDTGATMVALTYEDAERAGIYLSPSDFTHSVSTANGTIKAARTRLAMVELDGIVVRDVDAMVLPDEALSENLLGLSFLSKLKRFEYANGRLVLEQ